jgi:hypothetical protein
MISVMMFGGCLVVHLPLEASFACNTVAHGVHGCYICGESHVVQLVLLV